MPLVPASKLHVQAYRFELRRLRAALVSADPDLASDSRVHGRAMAAGLFLAAVLLLGFAVYGLIKPTANWRHHNIVLSKQSGALFVVLHQPDRLVPVPNLISARLLLARPEFASRYRENEADRGMEPTIVDESTLSGAARTPSVGILGLPHTLPNDDQKVSGPWQVCDSTSIPANSAARPNFTTAVLVGARSDGEIGRSLSENKALFVSTVDGQNYLLSSSNGSVWRTKVDKINAIPRLISTALLNAVPEMNTVKQTPSQNLSTVDARVLCLDWQLKDGSPQISLTVADKLPVPKAMKPVQLAQHDGSGDNLDEVFLPPGKTAVVRSVVEGQNVESGPRYLVSDQGVKYTIPTDDVLQMLGFHSTADAAPESMLRLLPTGPALDPATIDLTYDIPSVTSGR